MSDFFKEPNTITNEFGKLKIVAQLKVVEGLEDTCAAMDKVAHSEDGDSRTGDYTSSFEKLMNAFDTFVREFYKNFQGKNFTPGNKEIYNINDPIDLTIRLLWEIRHSSTHKGGMVDEKCKRKYEEILLEARMKNIKPRLNLPSTIQTKLQFQMMKTEYYSFKNDVFAFIGRLVPNEDLITLRKRSGITNVSFMPPIIVLQEEGDYNEYLVRYDDLVKVGIEIDGRDYPPTLPHYIIDGERKRIIFLDTGVAVPVVSRPKTQWPDKTSIFKK